MRLSAVSLAAVLLASTAQAAMIQLVPDHGTHLVPVEINGAIKLPFTIDTGATSVVIPDDVFQTLKRSGNVNDIQYIGPIVSILGEGRGWRAHGTHYAK